MSLQPYYPATILYSRVGAAGMVRGKPHSGVRAAVEHVSFKMSFSVYVGPVTVTVQFA